MSRYVIQLDDGCSAIVGDAQAVLRMLSNLRDLTDVSVYAENDTDFSEGLSAQEWLEEWFPLKDEDARRVFFAYLLPLLGNSKVSVVFGDKGWTFLWKGHAVHLLPRSLSPFGRHVICSVIETLHIHILSRNRGL